MFLSRAELVTRNPGVAGLEHDLFRQSILDFDGRPDRARFRRGAARPLGRFAEAVRHANGASDPGLARDGRARIGNFGRSRTKIRILNRDAATQ